MKRTVIIPFILALLVSVVIAAENYTGAKDYPSASTDIKLNFGTFVSVVDCKFADNDVFITFRKTSGDTSILVVPTSAAGDTAIPLEAGDVLRQEFPVRGVYPDIMCVTRASATIGKVYWR